MSDLAKTDKRSLISDLAEKHGLEPQKFYATVQEMCGCKNAKAEHFAGLLMVASQLDLNPVTRQLYLMPTQSGVQVVVPVDGYLAILNRHPRLVSHTCEIGSDDIGGNYAEVTIFTKDQVAAGLPPFKHREYMNECRGDSGPWRSHPIRMLKHKAYSQAVRYCFGVYAMDEDEWHRAGLAEDAPSPAPATEPAVTLDVIDAEPIHAGDDDQDTFDAEESTRIDAEVAEREDLFE